MVQKSFASLEDLASNMRKGLARTVSLEKAVDGIKTGIQRLKEGQLKLLFGKKEEKDMNENDNRNPIVWILLIIGAVAAVAAIAYAVYKYFTPDYLEDYDDDFDDRFDDDFFDDEEEVDKKAAEVTDNAEKAVEPQPANA